jgi:hypothetical protein
VATGAHTCLTACTQVLESVPVSSDIATRKMIHA